MAEIPLSRGFVAIVDDIDFERLSCRPWHAFVKRGGIAYARACIYVPVRRSRWVWMHKEILGADAGTEVDHIDGNTLNNKRDNLRIASRAQNSQNRKGWRDGYKGVQKISPNSYRVKIGVNGRRIYLGCFKTEIEAALAYDQAAKQWHGEFASLNFPDQPHSSPPSASEDSRRMEAPKCPIGAIG